MIGREVKGKLRRGLADFVIGLALFWMLAFAVHGEHGQALAVPLPMLSKQVITHDAMPSSPASAAAARSATTSQAAYDSPAARQQALVLLSIAVAGIFAFNLAFWRHLRRAYASPRRSVWRRG